MKLLNFLILFISINSHAQTEIKKSLVNEYFKQSVIVDEVEIHFDERLITLPITLSLCVGQDRRMSRAVKMLGCQNVNPQDFRNGKVILDGLSFAQAKPNRSLVYFFKWKTRASNARDYQESSIYIKIQR
jgi:hypothetical protein